MLEFKKAFTNMLCEMEMLTQITNKRSVLILLQHTKEEDIAPVIPAIRESASNIIAFVSLGDERDLLYIIDNAQGIVDTIVLDVDIKRRNSSQIRRMATSLAQERGIPIAYYSDYSSWISSAMAFMLEVEKRIHHSDSYEVRRLLVGRNPLATKMILEMVGNGMTVYLLKDEYQSFIFPYLGGTVEIHSPSIHLVDDLSDLSFDVLLGCELQKRCLYLDLLRSMTFSTIYDIGVNNFSKEFVLEQKLKGASVFRSDDRAGISGAVIILLETNELIEKRLGKAEIGGISLVSGGYFANEGDIVVDNFNNPHSILGVATGEGSFKSSLSQEDERRINKIKVLL